MPKNYKILKKSRIRKKPTPKRNLKKNKSVKRLKKMKGGSLYHTPLTKFLTTPDPEFLTQINIENVTEYKKKQEETRRRKKKGKILGLLISTKPQEITLYDLLKFMKYKIIERTNQKHAGNIPYQFEAYQIDSSDFLYNKFKITEPSWKAQLAFEDLKIESVNGESLDSYGLKIKIKINDIDEEFTLTYDFAPNVPSGLGSRSFLRIKIHDENSSYIGELTHPFNRTN